MRLAILGFLSCMAALMSSAFAEGVKRDAVQFETDSNRAAYDATIKGDESHEYVFKADAGRNVTISIKSDNRYAFFNVIPPGGGVALWVGSGEAKPEQYSGGLKVGGEYTVQVYLMRNAARRNETANFTISFALDGKTAKTAEQADFADGLMGGPDFWEVRNLRSGAVLNLRKGASTGDAVVRSLALGTILRNKGCKMANDKRWCEVELKDDAYIRGWVAGQFLGEAAMGQASTDALVPGTNYNAVGKIPCTLRKMPDAKDCDFGVTRGSTGVATVFIALPDKFVRVIAFDGNKVAPASGVTDFSAIRVDDRTTITIDGGEEVYSIFDAVVYGG